MQKHVWREANVRLVPSAVLAIVGVIMSSVHGNVRYGSINHKIVAVVGVVLFVIFATTCLRVFTSAVYRLVSTYHLTAGRAAALRFMLRIVGYAAILLTALDLIGVPVGRLLLGGAALGIILGVAAQQALGNFFASIVLIIAHPFSVGQEVTIHSGALGGKYTGKIRDIGLTHTKLKTKDGDIVLLPNASVLSNASVTIEKSPKA